MNNMDRVLTLCNKLQDQVAKNASVDQLLVTVEMLQSELMHLKLQLPGNNGQTAVSFHVAQLNSQQHSSPQEIDLVKEEKTVEILQVNEAELEAELEEIRRNAQAKNNMGVQNKPALLFDPVEDIPTLTHQQTFIPVETKNETVRPTEVHEAITKDQTASLNDKLKQAKIELGDSLHEVSIKDLRKAIGVNDRFVFISELFRGDEVMYERSIKTINSFSIFPEAEYWIKRELKLKLGWVDKNELVKQFDQLIKRRFL